MHSDAPRRRFHLAGSTLAALVAALFVAACAPSNDGGADLPTAAAARPNVVFVLLDDVRYDDVIDHPFVELPNLSRLIGEGASFRNFFTSAPLCSPSRAVFMTGQYPWRNGIVDNGERAELSHQIVTFPRLLHDAGYHTGFFGKWHMGHEDDTPRPGFDRWVSFVGQGVYFDPELNIDGELVQGEGYMTDLLIEEATDFIAAAPDDAPFLAFIAQKAVHPETHPNFVRTFPPAPGDEGLWQGEELPRDPSWRAPTDDKPALDRPVEFDDPRSPEGGLPDADVFGRLRMLAAVDRGLGSLIEALEARGVLDETLFVVTSDQGFFYGEFGLAQERRLAYEPSIHIPLVVRYPALFEAGSEPAVLASNVDIAPTLLELGGAPVPAGLDGVSLLPAITDPGAEVRDGLLVEYYTDSVFGRLQNMGYKALRTPRWKYIRYEELEGMDELYDLESDPFELDNLLPDRAPAEVLEQLQAQLDAQLSAEAAPLP
jgi:arylsulfatase A-like enzyme